MIPLKCVFKRHRCNHRCNFIKLIGGPEGEKWYHQNPDENRFLFRYAPVLTTIEGSAQHWGLSPIFGGSGQDWRSQALPDIISYVPGYNTNRMQSLSYQWRQVGGQGQFSARATGPGGVREVQRRVTLLPLLQTGRHQQPLLQLPRLRRIGRRQERQAKRAG